MGTYPEVHQSWVIVTAGDEAICLDPPGAVVRVYNPPDDCGNTPPDVCYTGQTVQDEYDVTFACTDENDVTYEDVDFYQAKCHADVAIYVKSVFHLFLSYIYKYYMLL